MTWEFAGQCVLGAVVIAGWFGVLYCACNRDYERKEKARRDAELAALQALGKDSRNYRGLDLEA